MDWINALVDLAIGVLSGAISSVITYFLIDRLLKERANYKNKLIDSYLFFKKMQNNFQSLSCDEILNELELLRIVYKNDDDLSRSFRKVDIGLCSVIRNIKSGGNASYSFAGDDYVEFMMILEGRIGN